jgi:NAD(P)H-dependent flavin oxidoreductase YrpB (nitropropane dioxygenase family)
VVACAEAWRGDGAILASPMGLIPSLGARLARLTFAPDLLLTDGEAYLLGAGGEVEGWLPYAKVFTMLAAGRRHVMMGAAQIDRYGNLAYGAAGIAMGTRFLLTSDSPVAGEVKRVYLAAGLDGTVVTRRVDGVPHRVLRTTIVDHLEGTRAGRGTRAGAGAGWLNGPRRAAALIQSARNAAAFRGVSGLSWPEMIRQGRAMHRESELTWGQVLMAANTPVLLRAAMVDGRPDLGLMSSGQVAGLIDDLPSCQELIEAIMAEAERCLDRLAAVRKA